MRSSAQSRQSLLPAREEALRDPNAPAVVHGRVRHLTPADRAALRAAVAALYFQDSADYESALWAVVGALLEFDDTTTGDLEFRTWAHALHPEWGTS
jgi:hypothetical protein